MGRGALCALLCGLAVAEALGRLERAGDSLSLVQGLIAVSSEQRRAELELGAEVAEAVEAVGEAMGEITASASLNQSAPSAGAASAATNESASAATNQSAQSSAAVNESASGASGLSAAAASLRERAAMLAAAKRKAVEEEDYDMAKQLKREMEVVLGESSLDQLKILKRAAVEEEDFDLAKVLKKQIQILENVTGTVPDMAAKIKGYYTTGQEPLPWGWRSARDPSSGMDYYWPVNDRAAVSWDRPTAAAPAVAPPATQAPAKTAKISKTSMVRTTTPPPPYEVKSAKGGGWARCKIDSNGTKPGTYNISVRAGADKWMRLPNIPGTVIRNATDQQMLLTETELLAIRKEQMVLKHWVGERLEVKTKSNAWVPCVVTGMGNETDTYNIHVPFAPVGHQDHHNVSVNILRKATSFGQKDEAPQQSGGEAGVLRAVQGGEEHRDKIHELAGKLTQAYWRHKKSLLEAKDKKEVKDPKQGKGDKADEEIKDGKDKASDSDDDLKALLFKVTGSVRLAAEASAPLPDATAFLLPDDRSWCLQGEPAYMANRLARLGSSPLAEGFTHAEITAGSCRDQGYEEGPLPDVCLEKASLYLASGHSVQETPFNNFLSTHGSEDVARGFMELCD